MRIFLTTFFISVFSISAAFAQVDQYSGSGRCTYYQVDDAGNRQTMGATMYATNASSQEACISKLQVKCHSLCESGGRYDLHGCTLLGDARCGKSL